MDADGPLSVAARIRDLPARLGGTRLVCVDGPAGSGKTTCAGRLAAALDGEVAVVHLDDLYTGWTLTGAVARLAAGVLRPIAEGRPGGYARFDWHAGRFAARIEVPVTAVLVVEGCGSSPRSLDPWTTARVWVEAPLELRTARGLARDGTQMAGEWRRWQRLEAAEFAREDTRARADVRLDGGAPLPE